MVSITYEQIAEAALALPLAAQQQLLGLLLAQPGMRDEMTKNGLPAQPAVNPLIAEGKKFAEEWIASLKRRPDDQSDAEDWLEAQAWSDL
ncbi:MAG: hypothetical protein HYR56_28655 [Acidobacteria bacterium]|nr:hypothetical protein [Acidobacteriota bacterium]MBI3423882.1 hypothetical protein [Acidobacteriota bacterium]